MFFASSCDGTDYRLDRMARVKKFVDKYNQSRTEWRALGKQAGESDEQHLQRLKQIFVFKEEKCVGTVGLKGVSIAQAKLDAAQRGAAYSGFFNCI